MSDSSEFQVCGAATENARCANAADSTHTQYTYITDRQDRLRSDSIGRTVLQTVAQKPEICCSIKPCLLFCQEWKF